MHAEWCMTKYDKCHRELYACPTERFLRFGWKTALGTASKQSGKITIGCCNFRSSCSLVDRFQGDNRFVSGHCRSLERYPRLRLSVARRGTSVDFRYMPTAFYVHAVLRKAALLVGACTNCTADFWVGRDQSSISSPQ